jgi:hypothetical protein
MKFSVDGVSLSTPLTLARAGLSCAANLLIKRHGEETPVHTAMRADELSAKGGMEGRAGWVLITQAIEELLCKDVP